MSTRFLVSASGIRVSALMLALMFAAAPAAQAQDTGFQACYVPGSGTMYRVGAPDTPRDCTSSDHVRFALAGAGGAGEAVSQAKKGSPGGSATRGGLVSAITVDGLGWNFSFSLQWVGVWATVTVAEGETIFVTSSKSLGGNNDMTGGWLDMCYQPVGGTLTRTSQHEMRVRARALTNDIATLSATLSLPAGTYDVGMCGYATDATNWNFNGQARTTVLVFAAR